MIRSNKNTGGWDFSILGKDFDFDFLKGIGFNDFELDNIFERLCKEDDFDAEAEYNKIKTPKTKKGDVYILGNHRLMCGNSTDEKDFQHLMNGKLARMIFTDPPYNVDYQSASKSIKKDNLKGKILNDKMTEEECLSFFVSALKNFYKFSSDDASIYWWYASTNQHICRDAFINAAWYLSQIVIWVKNGIVLSRSQDYHKTYEPCIFGWKKKKKHYKDKKIKDAKDLIILDKETFAEQLDVWYESRDNTAKYVHPTQKPVRLAERALKRNSRSKDIVLDGFGGSGSTLIACEQLDRHCYVMELDAKYCDVIVKRWELFTNQKARLMRG
jgi:DNA modification methylase